MIKITSKDPVHFVDLGIKLERGESDIQPQDLKRLAEHPIGAKYLATGHIARVAEEAEQPLARAGKSAPKAQAQAEAEAEAEAKARAQAEAEAQAQAAAEAKARAKATGASNQPTSQPANQR